MTITQKEVFEYWASKIQEYQYCGELNTTMMGEDAACYFGVCSENGDTQIESDLFDWAVDFERAKKEAHEYFLKTWGNRGHVCNNGSYKIF